jgi:hypothetical protein
MPGLVPGIHALAIPKQGVDGRDKPGHDEQLTLPVGSPFELPPSSRWPRGPNTKYRKQPHAK